MREGISHKSGNFPCEREFSMNKEKFCEKGASQMTNMKRMTISFSDEVTEALEKLKNEGELKGASYSKIINMLIKRGLAQEAKGA